jgi:hypothetical protein
VIYRNSPYQTGAIFAVTVDGKDIVGRLRPDGWFTAKLSPGTHWLSVHEDKSSASTAVTLEPGKVSYLRLNIDLSNLRLVLVPGAAYTSGNTRYTFEQVADQVALKELATLRQSE